MLRVVNLLVIYYSHCLQFIGNVYAGDDKSTYDRDEGGCGGGSPSVSEKTPILGQSVGYIMGAYNPQYIQDSVGTAR